MAGRSRRKSADYFSHDSDASSDEKIVYLESIFGHKGYAVYFKFLERMVRSNDFEIEWNDIKKAIYAAEFHISVTEIDLIVAECCRKEIHAFEINNGKMFSAGLKKRMQPLLDKREYNRVKYEEKKAASISVTEMTQSKEKESKGKDSKKEFLSDSIEYRLADYLLKFILKRNPNHKKPNIQSWAKNIDLMLRVDNRPEKEIELIIKWCQQSDFWYKNILSTGKLREKYDTLFLQMQEKKKSNSTQILTKKDIDKLNE